MDICVYNLSAESISVIPSHKRGSKPTTIAPSSSATVDIATHRPRLFSALHLQTVPKKQEEDLQRRRTYEIGPATINYGALKGWALVTDSESCPWRIYMRRVSVIDNSNVFLVESELGWRHVRLNRRRGPSVKYSCLRNGIRRTS